MQRSEGDGRPSDGRRLNNTHPALRSAWHPAARSSEIGEQPVRVEVLGKPYVVFRSSEGELVAFLDRCPHRLAPLSLGRPEDDVLRCAYHGWCFDASGRCVEIPRPRPRRDASSERPSHEARRSGRTARDGLLGS